MTRVQGDPEDLAQNLMLPTYKKVRNVDLDVVGYCRYYILLISSSAGVPRAGGVLVLCSTDSARGRFKDDDAADLDADLTDGGVSVLV